MGLLQSFKRFANWVNSFRKYHYNFPNEVMAELKDGIAILEVGCNLRPLIPSNTPFDFIHDGLDPDPLIDLADASMIFSNFYQTGIEDFQPERLYDVIVLDMVFEHLEDNNRTIEVLKTALKTDGKVFINLPSNLHPFTILNQMVPAGLRLWLLKTLRPWSEPGHITGWKSYYDKCNIVSFKKLLRKHNMKLLKASFHYNGADYFAFFPPLYLLVVMYEEVVGFLKVRVLASHFMAVITKN